MIAKVTSGSGFRGVLNYLMNEKKQSRESEKSREKELERTGEKTLERESAERADAAKGREKVAVKIATRELSEEQNRAHTEAQKRVEKSDTGRELLAGEKTSLGERAMRHRVIGGNMSGQSPRELAREFGVFREQRSDIEKPVHHVSLSAGESDKLSIKQWNKIAAKYVEQMGFGSSPYVIVQHIDAAHDHIHIVTSRIDLNGKVVPDFRSKLRAEEVMREVEREHNLERVAPSRDAGRRAPTRGELEKFARTGEPSVKMRLQDAVDWSLKDAPDVAEFIRRLDRIGVRVNPNLQHTGIASGISFEREGEVMKGSDLGRDYTWQGLQKRGLGYEQERDRKVLTEAKIRYLEAAQARGKSRKDAGEVEREIAEWRHSVAQLSRPSSVAPTREPTRQEISADAELNRVKKSESQPKIRGA